MKIAFFNLGAWEKEYLQVNKEFASLQAEKMFFESPLGKDTIPADRDFDIVSVFIDSIISQEVLDALPNLKYIATSSTGYDHIDIEICKARNIAVSNVPTYGEHTVAEYTFALMLALLRKICESNHRVKESGSFNLQGLRGFDLSGKTLGVIGTGKIGRNVIKIAKGFNMEVVAFDPYPDDAFAESLAFRYAPFEEVLKLSDIITLHVPYNNKTHHLINKDSLQIIKKGAWLINTSRGGIIETEALIEALQNGSLAGAALDVLEEEGIIKDELHFLLKNYNKTEEVNLRTVLADHALIDMPNVIITPHNAFNTEEALKRILDATIQNIKGFIEGNPVNLVS